MTAPESVTAPSSAEVVLDPSHRYVHVPTGRIIPSVSSILRKARVREVPFTGGGARSEAVAKALQRGTDVHRLTRAMDESYDISDAFEDQFDPADISVENLDYVAGYDKFLRTSEYRPLAWETIVWDPVDNYAGRVDAVGWFRTKRIMIDRKTDKTLHRAVWLQLGAYKHAWDTLYPTQPIDQTYALILRSDMTFQLVPNPIEDSAFHFFRAAIWLGRFNDMVL